MEIILKEENKNRVYLGDLNDCPEIVIAKHKGICKLEILVRVDSSKCIAKYKWRCLDKITKKTNYEDFTNWRTAIASKVNCEIHCFKNSEEFIAFIKEL